MRFGTRISVIEGPARSSWARETARSRCEAMYFGAEFKASVNGLSVRLFQ